MSCCCSSSSKTGSVSIEELRNQADCTLYTYGVGRNILEASPPYFLRMAKENREKSYAMIHCDPAFMGDLFINYTPQLAEDWEKLSTDGESYRHKKIVNLTVRFIHKNFPTSSSFDPEFQMLVQDRLEQGGELFLGVHNACYTDQGCMGETYNLFREKYKGRIHFYIQCADAPSFIYKGAYHPLMGLFARELHFRNRDDWDSFVRLFSPHRSPSEAEKVLSLAREFLVEILPHVEHLSPREEAARRSSYYHLCDYINKPLDHRLVVTPLEQLNYSIFYKELEPNPDAQVPTQHNHTCSLI